jgi:hypothetical protein
VSFDLEATGESKQWAWTAPGSDEGFLVLDRNSNGRIDDGSELFGNYTDQADPPEGTGKNGFNALKRFDSNGDGQIDASDAVFSTLRMWQDANHDGVSQASELRSLSDFGIVSISLDYVQSLRVDEFGNMFRYEGALTRTADSIVNRVVTMSSSTSVGRTTWRISQIQTVSSLSAAGVARTLQWARHVRPGM